MNSLLRKRFPDFQPLKTHQGAQARIDRWLAGFNNLKDSILFVVVEVDDVALARLADVACVDTGHAIELQSDPRGAVLLVRLPGETEAVSA